MLPLYGTEGVHHRGHGIGNGQFPSPSHIASSFVSAARGAHGQKRGWVSSACQVFLLLCVLLPLWLLVSDKVTLPAGLRPPFYNRKVLGAATAVPLPASYLRNLVLVAGHAVYVGVDFHEATKESSWFLEDYQKVPGEAQSFVDHIALGVQEAHKDPSAMLMFSGGQTRREAGPRSEGLSYWVVAEAALWFNTSDVRNRTFTEEHARDSFENLLFGLCRFYELTGHYPEHVTVVSYTLKRDRFVTLHREALRFPFDRFHFLGTPIPPAAQGATEGEARTVAAFRNNPYGCEGELLQKRLRRDPFAVGPIHPSRCPAMHDLLMHCGNDLFEGVVPWSSTYKL